MLSSRNQSPTAVSPRGDNDPLGNVWVKELIDCALVLMEEWVSLPPAVQAEIARSGSDEKVLELLEKNGLLTDYQRARIEAGTTHGLILGNYRVLDRLGAGGMGVVFRAEHIDLRRQVAVKVLSLSAEQDPRIVTRFMAEMRAVARLNHPNIVGAMDAGTLPSPRPGVPTLRYFVMEYVPGQDLEECVNAHGPMPAAKACDVAYQIACALSEAHKYHFVHRDIKPSNIVLNSEGQAKLLDFGLARQLDHRLTLPGSVLGTLDYLAPEQARDASSVDIRADIYGLGGTLFWCLTGRVPFQEEDGAGDWRLMRMSNEAPSACAHRAELPAEMDEVLARMMANKPKDRYPTPQALMEALLPFLSPEMNDHRPAPGGSYANDRLRQAAETLPGAKLAARVLIVDDEPSIREYCSTVLRADGMRCDEAANGALALKMVQDKPFDLVLLDMHMPGILGHEVLRRLRQSPPCPNLKVIIFSGKASPDEMSRMLLAGADDFLTKPFSVVQLQGRVKSALRLKDAQDRSELLNQRMLAVNAELERSLSARNSDLVQARNALVLALARMVAQRDTETGAHLVRLQTYCRCLAEEAALSPSFASQIDRSFIEMLECCAPLHDIGKVGLPDHILLKPGKLTNEERMQMQAHTVLGANMLKEVAKQHGSSMAFLHMAIDIARHHHERFDGAGYPDRLAGTDIPLCARLVAVADVYDALRSRRVYKPALSHATAMNLVLEGSPGQFEPALLDVFKRCADQFDRIFHELTDASQHQASEAN